MNIELSQAIRAKSRPIPKLAPVGLCRAHAVKDESAIQTNVTGFRARRRTEKQWRKLYRILEWPLIRTGEISPATEPDLCITT